MLSFLFGIAWSLRFRSWVPMLLAVAVLGAGLVLAACFSTPKATANSRVSSMLAWVGLVVGVCLVKLLSDAWLLH